MRAEETRPTAFVLLGIGFGGDSWHARWRNGQIIGLNEPYAYGYHHAEDHGFRVVYSQDRPEGPLSRLVRMGWRALLGFDIVHPWRNREAFFNSNVVWTHTEYQGLAAVTLCLLFPRRRRPRLILQSVWLIDRWETLGPLRRRFFRYLLQRGDILSFHSPANTERARAVFPNSRCELILFGINADDPKPPADPSSAVPVRLLAPGSDRHRDWRTLIEAVRGMANFELRIVSRTCDPRLLAGVDNVRIERPADNAELTALYQQASAVVVPLVENMHASGITVIEEATQMGRPVIATQVGGLEAYFGPDCLTYVPPRDVDALRQAIARLITEPHAAHDQVVAAQRRMREGGISSRDYARQHAEWSRELLA
ncbi:glycosyltransferase [Ancylobacter dichloromethanicus]|uniref:Glycosyltransferase group 1 protein n=1 Tax=Ancylobacter dichloromethanicus TaxID=518825 RepID=A0A9W6MZC5_9HYPH|nr:glycosyltransferase [Ancylobacter dichloromethanicus]MBS7554810.1 glycosyltransferase [Ancylobacter dichloromethanicus]GLK71875.1 glycosyltransferase group 1 protein [Ancylobacter dichloromethanicus]